MTNQEAIVEGVMRWLDGSRDAVLLSFQRGAEKAALAIGEAVGLQASMKIQKFFDENGTEIVTAYAAQMVVSSMELRGHIGNASVTDGQPASPAVEGEPVA